MSKNTERELEQRETVRREYGKIAVSSSSCGCSCGCGCGPSADDVASALGYSDADLAGLPEGANMGLSCGNPTAVASLRPGEVVLDLGSGGGFDAFIVARKVGPTGRVIGVDMTPDMISKARRNIIQFRSASGLENVEFRLGEIEHLPVADSSVDVVISNCVINLSPEKQQIWHEIFRVLKPGGRVSVSDIALLRPLPAEILQSLEALVGCVAGAALIEDTKEMVQKAGLTDASFEQKSDYMDSMVQGADPLWNDILAKLPAGAKLGDYVTSMIVAARKPLDRQLPHIGPGGAGTSDTSSGAGTSGSDSRCCSPSISAASGCSGLHRAAGHR